MSSVYSELVSAGLMPPKFDRSNVEVAKEIARGGGRLVGRDNEKMFFLVIDALGYDLLEKAIAKSSLLRNTFGRGDLQKISTLFPSFTPTVFTSIDSGLLPSEHGIVGSPMPIREFGAFQDIFGISWWPAKEIDLAPIFPQPDIVLAMSKQRDFVYLQDEKIIRKSEKSDAIKKITAVPYISQDDFVFKARKLARSARLIYAYIWEVDHIQHIYTKSTRNGFEVVLYVLERLAEKVVPYLKKEGWRVVITSDHGQVSTRRKDTAILTAKSGIMKDLSMPPWGTESTVFFQVANSREKAFETKFEKMFGKRFLIYNSDEVIKAGLFGKRDVAAKIRYRFGTYTAISTGRYSIRYIRPGSDAGHIQLGRHGGMTKEEMEIPLLIL